MTTDFDHFFQCVEADGHWEFQVGVIAWDGSHTPRTDWKKFRSWHTQPDATQLVDARTAALKNPRFFRTCTQCGELNNAGHMHDQDICQGCATRYLGAIY